MLHLLKKNIKNSIALFFLKKKEVSTCLYITNSALFSRSNAVLVPDLTFLFDSAFLLFE